MVAAPISVESQSALKCLPVAGTEAGAEAGTEAVAPSVAVAARPVGIAPISEVVIAVDADRNWNTECIGCVAACVPLHATARTRASATGLENDVLA